MRVKITAISEIIGITSIEGLKALDSYYEEIIAVDDDTDMRDLLEQFKEKYPEFSGWKVRAEEMKGE